MIVNASLDLPAMTTNAQEHQVELSKFKSATGVAAKGQSARTNVPRVTVYLQGMLIEHDSGSDVGELVTELHACQSYRIRIIGHKQPFPQAQPVMIFGDAAGLHLKSTTPHSEWHLDTADLFCTFESSFSETWCHDFLISVDETCPIGKVAFSVSIISAGIRSEVKVFEVDLAGTYSPPEPDFYESVQIALDAAPPDNVAVFRIRPGNGDGFWIADGFNRKCKALSELRLSRPKGLNGEWLWKLADADLERVRREFSGWSRTLDPNLLQWFEDMRNSYGDHFVLVIVDMSYSNFPWELVHVVDAELREIPIGALAIVVRWIPTRYFTSRHVLYLEDELCEGGTHAFFDKDLLGVDIERKSADKFEIETSEQLAEFAGRIATSAAQAAFFYAGCHGDFPEEPDILSEPTLFTQGGIAGAPQEIGCNLFDSDGFEADYGNRPLVFLNACHSARLIQKEQHIAGFAEVLLARWARAFVGTLGYVNSQNAAVFAAALFEELLDSEEGVSIAEFLLHQRASAMAGFHSDRDVGKLLDAFMYVYYGNPFLRLKLFRASSALGSEPNHES